MDKHMCIDCRYMAGKCPVNPDDCIKHHYKAWAPVKEREFIKELGLSVRKAQTIVRKIR